MSFRCKVDDTVGERSRQASYVLLNVCSFCYTSIFLELTLRRVNLAFGSDIRFLIILHDRNSYNILPSIREVIAGKPRHIEYASIHDQILQTIQSCCSSQAVPRRDSVGQLIWLRCMTTCIKKDDQQLCTIHPSKPQSRNWQAKSLHGLMHFSNVRG